MARIASCNWKGAKFRAEHSQTRPDGSMVMIALEHGPRFLAGSRVVIQPAEVTAWEEAEPSINEVFKARPTMPLP